jgi:DNA/RNA endonuclease YhcR with UshA esterase domain
MTRTILVLCLALATAPAALARAPQKMYGADRYDTKKEVTLTGTITVSEEHRGPGGAAGIHLRLKTDTDTIEIHVGPKAYLAREGVTFKVGETVTVLGARTTFEGENVIVAREIRTAAQLITLRDESGRPRWAGGADKE